MENSEVEHIHRHHTGRQWVDLVLGICAVSISFISLFLALHNGKAMEQLVQANSWPFVQITFSNLNSDGSPHVHFDVANKGVGPARIESLEATYQGLPLGDPRAVLNALLNRTTVPPHPRIQTSTVAHTVLAAKEVTSFIDFKPEEFSVEDYDAIRLVVSKVHFLACYCSVFDECWMADTTKTRPARVKECPTSTSTF